MSMHKPHALSAATVPCNWCRRLGPLRNANDTGISIFRPRQRRISTRRRTLYVQSSVSARWTNTHAHTRTHVMNTQSLNMKRQFKWKVACYVGDDKTNTSGACQILNTNINKAKITQGLPGTSGISASEGILNVPTRRSQRCLRQCNF